MKMKRSLFDYIPLIVFMFVFLPTILFAIAYFSEYSVVDAIYFTFGAYIFCAFPLLFVYFVFLYYIASKDELFMLNKTISIKLVFFRNVPFLFLYCIAIVVLAIFCSIYALKFNDYGIPLVFSILFLYLYYSVFRYFTKMCYPIICLGENGILIVVNKDDFLLLPISKIEGV